MNKVFMTVMRLGLIKDGPMVLTVTGRKSGKPRSTPITPFTVDGKRYVVGGFPGADWVRNARAADVATLTQGRRSERVRMVEVPADEDGLGCAALGDAARAGVATGLGPLQRCRDAPQHRASDRHAGGSTAGRSEVAEAGIRPLATGAEGSV